MADAQELLSHVIVDPNDHDPDKRMEAFNEAIDFENIFVEPPDLQSCDVIWLCSRVNFERTKQKAYHVYRYYFCFYAALWGISFALTSYCETFISRPIGEMIKICQKIPSLPECISIYTRGCKELFCECFNDDEDERRSDEKKLESKII